MSRRTSRGQRASKTTLLWGLTLLSLIGPTWGEQFYIDEVPEYSLLNSCAEPPLSGVVRGQKSGCGASTSYSCFCVASSSKFAGIISTAVLSACPGSTTDADSATSVFSLYCQLSAAAAASASTTEPSQTSQPATTTAAEKTDTSKTTSDSTNVETITVPSTLVIFATPAPSTSSSITATPSASSAAISESGTNSSLSGTTLTLVIILIIVIVLLSIAVAFFWWRYRKQRASSSATSHQEDSHGTSSSVSETIYKAPAPYYPEKGDEGSLIELDDRNQRHIHEIQSTGDTSELPVSRGHVATMMKDNPMHKRVKSRTVRHSAQELL